jgi:hypothetical protein
VRHGREVLAQEVAAEVAVVVAPHRVDVVAVVLRVVVLEHERRALYLVEVGLTRLAGPGPGERDLVDAGGSDLAHPIRRDVGGHHVRVALEQLRQQVALRRRHLRRGEAEGVGGIDLEPRATSDIAHRRPGDERDRALCRRQ